MLPHPTARLRFRKMTPGDLDAMASMLGDPKVMTFYPAPKPRGEAAAWIAWNQANYASHGYGLWLVETHDGEFVGDCGLTWQNVNDRLELEVGYHVRVELQGRGYATEAALACLEYARDVLGAGRLVAINHPDNMASRCVAEHLGMRHLEDDLEGSTVRTVMGVELGSSI
ncbi:GNAT family N-acetyltransferase [Paenarthrobacter sp. NPDC057981]|uniref:GNAT family N-acetyltransferase n=1 Tax=Paenarthrobacter sp. NPDC057981 TaxID=3346297 RepID=UPI0036D84F05